MGLVVMLLAACGPNDAGGQTGTGQMGASSGTGQMETRISCPPGFVAVFGNTALGTDDFCVMQFEAKKGAGDVPVSQASNTPWVSITPPDAQSACEALAGTAGFSGTFSLISNPEWMTIARDIERVASNWSGGSVGSGHIPRGHSDGMPNEALAVTDETDPYDGTGNNSGETAGSGWEQRRRHDLSNGNTIWDLAGNIGEWVDWDATDTGFTTKQSNVSNSWRELTELSSSVTADDLQPIGGYDSSHSFGKWHGGEEQNSAVSRGHRWAGGRDTGVFTSDFRFTSNTQRSEIGFRCVYRP